MCNVYRVHVRTCGMNYRRGMAEKKSKKDPHPFGDILREFREKTGKSKYWVAAQSGRKHSQIYQIESAGGEPKISTIHWYAKIIGVPAEDIIREMLKVLDELDRKE